MSHLTANPFAKHFEFPRPGPPLTPPDTESEYANHALQPPPAPAPAPLALGIDLGDPLPILSSHRSIPSAVTEVPPLRKGPSLQYIHSGPREARERVVQRGVRWLVVVVPPASVVTDRAHFGHTLSVGTPEKLPEGLLMPLFPTMSGQIGAIAREFSFPSTSGICLYLHTNVEGLATMPRISDEAWQMLWAAYFEPRSPTTSGSPGLLPISGRIEFDIDLRKARWYDTWLGSGRRDLVDVPVSVTPSRPQSVSHWRGDSRTTFLDDQQDDQNESTSMLTIARGPGRTGSRHIPRKLSLLDRVEALSLRSGSKLNPRNLSPPSPGLLSRDAVAAAAIAVGSVLALSPVAQEDEPKSAQKDINMRVNSWRESASLAASPMAATGQTSLDPANMPNDLPLVEDEVAAAEELNLDDFAWSVSSLGPPDDEYDDADERASLESWRLPSVHMDRRMAASVCLTPTTATSWGPVWDSDYEYDDAAADGDLYWTSYSPDLGERMMEDCPPTPTTATSWGPASYDAASPLSQASFVLSIDLGARMMEDCPPTPTTATSWGPASYDAGSPISNASFALSIDLAHRGAGSVPLTPATATSWGPPLEWPPSPSEPHYVRTPDVGQRTFDVDAPLATPWHHVWPYQGSDVGEEENEQPLEFLYPSHDASLSLHPQEQQSGPWRQVWPYRAPSPATVEREGVTPYPFVYPFYDAPLPSRATESGPWKQVWPYRAPSPSTVETEGAGPYPFVYPYYNAASTSTSTLEPPRQVWSHQEEVSDNAPYTGQKQLAFTMVFPWQGADSGKPVVEPYRRAETKSSFVGASAQNYPYLAIYPAVYPHHDFYPAPAAADIDAVWMKERPVRLEVAYPTVRPYHPGYPHIELYPPVSFSSSRRSAAPVAVEKVLEPVSLKVTVVYPVIDIYPSVYPHNLSEIYGPATTKSTLSTDPLVAHPVVVPYQHVYPYNLKRLYPALELARAKEQHVSVEIFEVMSTMGEPITHKLPTYYPNISLYEPGYPWNLEHIYPPVCSADSDDNECEDPTAYPHSLRYIYNLSLRKEAEVIKKAEVVQLAVGYPAMEIYSPVYPWNLEHIYPSVSAAGPDDNEGVDPTAYPHSLRYIYSHSTSKEVQSSKEVRISKDIEDIKETEVVKLALGYPALEIYSPVYPWNLEYIYPSVRSAESQDDVCEDPTAYPHNLRYIYTSSPKKDTIVVKLVAEYPAMEIYSSVYPCNLDHIYPSVKPGEMTAVRGATGIVVALHTNYPHIELYAPVYPHNLQSIYPSTAALTTVSISRASKHNTHAIRTSRPHLRDHSHHAKRSSSVRLPPPPVPPLPQNVDLLRPIHPASRRPLSGERVAMSLPVRLPAFYPMICLYPPAYPHFDLYPQRATAPAFNHASVSPVMLQSAYPVLNIYPAVYPFLEIYPQAAASKIVSPKTVDTTVKDAPIAANGFLPRKQPKRTHEELHRMIFGDSPMEETKSGQEEVVLASKEIPQQNDVVPAPATVPILEESTPPKTSRRLPPVPPPQMPLPPVPPPQMPLPPVPPPQIPLPSIPTQTVVPVPQSPALTNAIVTSSPVSSPSPSPRSRARSGTVSARPPLPSPPATALSIAPALVSVSAPSPVTTSPTVRRLPALPEDASASPPTTPSRRPMSVRVGLPSSPAATRRMSIVQPPSRRATSFAPLASVPEPSVSAPMLPTASPVSPFRPLPPQPQSQMQTPERSPPPPADLQRSHSASLRPSSLAPVSEGSDLSRRKSLPPRPLPRTRRDSVAAAPSGTVAGLARAYNTSTLSTVDEQVSPASPPRAPLPPVPRNRPPVSKLDRSKYPFA